MSESEDMHDISTQGEAFSSAFSFTWLNPGPIAAGEAMAPAKLTSHAARRGSSQHCTLCWATLHLLKSA